jgi:hypothetical protein
MFQIRIRVSTFAAWASGAALRGVVAACTTIAVLAAGSVAYATPTLMETVVTSADLVDNITAGATLMGTIIATVTLAFFGFLIVRKGWRWASRGLG